MKEFKDKNYKLIMGISVACLVLIIFASSYGYFKTKIINNTNPFSVKVGKVDLLIDTNQITIENAAPILDEEKNEKAVTKTFTIKRTSDSNLDICYNLYLVIDQITDNIKNSKYLKYELTDKKSGEVILKNLSTVAYSEGKSTILLKNQYLSDSDTTGVEYELKVWLSYDEVEDQMSLLGGSLTAHLYVSGMQGTTCPVSVETLSTLKDKLLADNPTISTRTDFSTPFTTNTANTLYKATENGTDVYYFAGQDTESTPINNWVKFGKYETDLIVYRGYYSSTSSSYKDYQTLEACTSASSYNVNCTLYKFASAGDDMYWRIIRTNADGSIRLLYHGTSHDSTTAYISSSTEFNSTYNDSKYVGYMYDSNGTSSTIKNTIDTWYSSNLTNYTKYLSTSAIYCNDRTSTVSGRLTDFGAYTRLYTNETPSYDCTNDNDKFTVDASSGNGKLTYPIALMTADEIAYAGGVYEQEAPMWYCTNSSLESSTGSTDWWTMSPYGWDLALSYVFRVVGSNYPGRLGSYTTNESYGVRPVISLKSCIKYSTGDGTSETPYEIVETSSGC